MKSTCLFKMPHSCGTKDALQVFACEDGKITGFCFACSTYVSDPMGEGKTVEDVPKKQILKKSQEEILEEMEFISTLKAVDLEARRLRKGVLDYYGIKIGFSEKDGKTPRFAYFPYTENGNIVKYKVKLLDTGRVWSTGISNNVDLFGWEQAKESGAKRLIIVEGEFDAPALKRICEINTKEEFKEHQPAVVSLPNGAGNAKRDLTRLLPEIRKHFKDISFCFDTDEAGKKATEDCCVICPEAKVITLPKKDANDCLIEGAGKAAYKAITFNAEKPKNSRLVWASTLHEQAKEPAKWGYSWPWTHINDATRGIRLGETVYIGAGQKQGKSELVNTLIAHFITEHKWKVFAAKPEEANKKTYKMVAGKIVGRIFHDPKVPFDGDAFDKAGEVIGDNLALINIYQHLGWNSLKSDIMHAAAEGCKAVFIDPITCLVNGMDAASANTKLQEIAQDLSAMALDLDIVIFISCHLRNPDSGEPHERGGKVLSSQFAGSRAMARSCNIMVGLEGNRDPDLPEQEQNMRKLVVLENREVGDAGSFGLFYNKKTGLFSEL